MRDIHAAEMRLDFRRRQDRIGVSLELGDEGGGLPLAWKARQLDAGHFGKLLRRQLPQVADTRTSTRQLCGVRLGVGQQDLRVLHLLFEPAMRTLGSRVNCTASSMVAIESKLGFDISALLA